jgi:hypothetical protein
MWYDPYVISYVPTSIKNTSSKYLFLLIFSGEFYLSVVRERFGESASCCIIVEKSTMEES